MWFCRHPGPRVHQNLALLTNVSWLPDLVAWPHPREVTVYSLSSWRDWFSVASVSLGSLPKRHLVTFQGHVLSQMHQSGPSRLSLNPLGRSDNQLWEPMAQLCWPRYSLGPSAIQLEMTESLALTWPYTVRITRCLSVFLHIVGLSSEITCGIYMGDVCQWHHLTFSLQRAEQEEGLGLWNSHTLQLPKTSFAILHLSFNLQADSLTALDISDTRHSHKHRF